MAHKQPPQPPRSDRSGAGSFAILVALLAVVVAGALYYSRRAPAQAVPTPASAMNHAPAQMPATTPSADSTTVPDADMPGSDTPPDRRPVAGVPAGPWPADLPPLPLGSYDMAQPIDRVRTAYRFAGEHPEVLKYVPCFCGCQMDGHQSNEDCFVASRDANGRVASWQGHGMMCNVCLNVAHDAMQMHASGAPVSAIRTAVERKYKPMFPNETPTPPVPHP